MCVLQVTAASELLAVVVVVVVVGDASDGVGPPEPSSP